MPTPSPTLTRKDFERIARALSDLQAATFAIVNSDTPGRDARLSRAFDSAALDIAKVVAQTNGKFDTARFIAACRPEVC